MIVILVSDIDLAENIRELLTFSGVKHVVLIDSYEKLSPIPSGDIDLIVYSDPDDIGLHNLTWLVTENKIPIIVLTSSSIKYNLNGQSIILELPFDAEELIAHSDQLITARQTV
ncbi:MAG: hypothetical protein AAFX87_09375 [Bacteroidota bacterium]